jgi:sugar phosphate isomerase/epimerase
MAVVVPETMESSVWTLPPHTSRPFYLAHLTLLHLAPPRFVTVAAEAGYDGVSLHLTPPGLSDPGALSYPMLGSTSVMMRETLARLNDFGIHVHDIQAMRLTPNTRLGDFLPMLDAGSRLGASYAIVVSDDPDEARNADKLAELGDLCARFGLRVALEFMAYSGIRTLQQAGRIVEKSRSPHVVILLDALHLKRSGGTPADVMQMDRRLIPYLQICDSQDEPLLEEQGGLRWEARRERVIPGWGRLPLHELVGMLPPELPLAVEVPSESLHQAFEDATIARMALDATRNLCNQVMAAHARRGE